MKPAGSQSNLEHAASFDDNKKAKLMYTSDFLKSFDRPLSRSTSFNHEDEQEQVNQLRHIILKLKSTIEDSKDEQLVQKMKDILNENPEGQLLLKPASIIPPLSLPEHGESPRNMTSSSSSSNIAGIFSNLLTPTSSSNSLGKPNSARSPRARGNGAGNTTNKQATLASSASISNSSASDRNMMKRSPSMPVITKERSQQNVQSELKLQKKTKSTEGADLKTSKSVNDAKPKNQELVSPRKGIKKSVSMSSIFAQDEKDKTNAVLKCTSLEEIVGQIYPLTKYQAGCRFLQKKLEEQSDPQHVSMVFNEVFEHLIELMTDPYGQYLVPKLMKHCDKNQRQQIVTKIAPKIVTFACHTYGIHGVQKILEFLTTEQVNTFVEVISPSVILLAKDSKGNYLIQSFLKQFPPEQNQFIFDSINANCAEVASHKVGCTLVNRCIDNANEKQLNELVAKISAVSLNLVQDQFGNYVVQHLLATKPQFSASVAKALLGHIPELSVQKFSSNVIEKCLQVADAPLFSSIIDELTSANLLELLQDRYANFVIQTALDVADEEQHAQLVKQILPFIHQIKTPYVMHIQKKILQV